MNRRILMAISLTATAFVAVAASPAVADTKTYWITNEDGTRTDVDCGNQQNTIGIIDPLFPAFAFDPLCITIFSGQKVTWTSGRFAHDPGSDLDGGECFRALTDTGALLPGSNPPGQHTYTVKFYYDGVMVRSTYDMVNDRPCPVVTDPLQTTLNEGVLQYQCFVHPWMKGLIVIKTM